MHVSCPGAATGVQPFFTGCQYHQPIQKVQVALQRLMERLDIDRSEKLVGNL